MNLVSDGKVNWEEVRMLFPVTKKYIFFETNRGPLSLFSKKAIEEFVSEQLESKTDKNIRTARVEETRNNVAQLLGAEPNEIAFVKNTSEGLNIIANGFPLNRGDKVILNNCEHPNAIYCWKNLERRGIEIIWVPTQNGIIHLEDLQSVVDERTKVLVVSSVTYAPGNQNDLSVLCRFCRERGILSVVDGMQSVGTIPIDVNKLGVDVLVSGGQKYLFSPMGIGILFCSNRIMDKIDPIFASGAGIDSDVSVLKAENNYEIKFKNSCAKFELGTHNSAGIMSLNENLKMLLQIGIENVEKHVLEVNDRLVQGLLNLGLNVTSPTSGPLRSSIVTFEHPDANALFDRLFKNGVRMSVRKGLLRACLGLYSNIEDADRFIEIVRKETR